MEDSNWYLQQRDRMEESLWYLCQQSRCLQDFRSNIRGIWDDDAATEIDRRFLDPHAQDSSQAAGGMTAQLTSISSADIEFDLASQAGAKATQISQQIDLLLRSAHEDIDRSRAEYSVYQERHHAACGEIANIEMLIAQAG